MNTGDEKMVCTTKDALRQIRRLGESAYSLRMVLLSIAQTHPNLVVEAVHKLQGEPDNIEQDIKDVLKREGKVSAIRHYMKRTGTTLDYAHNRVVTISGSIEENA